MIVRLMQALLSHRTTSNSTWFCYPFVGKGVMVWFVSLLMRYELPPLHSVHALDTTTTHTEYKPRLPTVSIFQALPSLLYSLQSSQRCTPLATHPIHTSRPLPIIHYATPIHHCSSQIPLDASFHFISKPSPKQNSASYVHGYTPTWT
jgi:hypothetical protein